ncbi:hypothetical protein HYPSUDRAFT_275509 [Hypholoma sublateritium FD-334 SS-4]|uniref:Uncharacterized protein n=1 Tax=Hypholoma sublateritium (strain FD-334 SS-4) TaxID=945553 RepID=A0A0D2P6B5_HYPSF|nr:hypothetical protein HYPSUDRAFT_275509 [Hypholoma sublateritium FD-334 SS-4]
MFAVMCAMNVDERSWVVDGGDSADVRLCDWGERLYAGHTQRPLIRPCAPHTDTAHVLYVARLKSSHAIALYAARSLSPGGGGEPCMHCS